MESSVDDFEFDDEVDVNQRMFVAAHNGFESIVQLMLFRGANAYKIGLTSATVGGHENIVQLMLERGATNYNHAMSVTAQYAHEAIVRLMARSWSQ